MALGDGGLDAQVEQRMDAYRGNPQQLQKRYGQNKELLDLMALQKLKKEKEDTARDMQLKAGQNPDTIAQQREKEVLELVKNETSGSLGELTGRTAETLNQKARSQKQGMNKLMKRAAKPPAGIAGLMGAQPPQTRPPMPPQAQGLPNARMAQAAAQGGPRRMANGGIVGFQSGEEVGSPFGRGVRKFLGNFSDDMRLQKLREKIKTKYGLFASPIGGLRTQSDEQRAFAKNVLAQADNLSEEQLIALDNAEFTSGMSAEALSALPTNLSGNLSEDSTETISQPLGVTTGPMLEIPEGGIQELLPPPKQKQQTNQNPPTVTEVVEQKTVPPFVASDGSNAPVIEAPETSVPMVGGEDPMAQMQLGFDAANKETGRAEKAAEYDEMLAELKAFDAENYDPERERKDRLKAFLMGAAGTTNIGSTFAQAGTSAMNLGSSQRKERRGRLIDKFNMQKSKMATDTALAQTSVQLGKELFTQSTQDNRAAMQAGVQMRGQDLTRAQENARNLLETMKNEDANSYRQQTIALDEIKQIQKTMNDDTVNKNNRIVAANSTIARTLIAREYFAEEAKKQVNLGGLALQLENAELSGLEGEELKAVQDAYNLAAAEALVLAESMMNMFGRGGTPDNPTGVSLLDVEQQAIQVLAELQQLTEDDVQSVKTTGN